MAILIDEKAMPRTPVTEAERAAVASSGAGKVAEKFREPEKPVHPAHEEKKS
ncbi:MAG: hypothetical protein ABI640_21935 [Gammaproteobacteria bacterium]